MVIRWYTGTCSVGGRTRWYQERNFSVTSDLLKIIRRVLNLNFQITEIKLTIGTRHRMNLWKGPWDRDLNSWIGGGVSVSELSFPDSEPVSMVPGFPVPYTERSTLKCNHQSSKTSFGYLFKDLRGSLYHCSCLLYYDETGTLDILLSEHRRTAWN